MFEQNFPKMESAKVTNISEGTKTGNILYLMRRDKRIFNNFCVEYCYEFSKNRKFHIGIQLNELKMNKNKNNFIIETLMEVERDCNRYNIFFDIIDDLNLFISDNKISDVIIDFCPLESCKEYKNKVLDIANELNVALSIIESHSIVPSNQIKTISKSSRGIGCKLSNFFNFYFEENKKLVKHPFNKNVKNNNNLQKYFCKSKRKNIIINELKGGHSEALEHLEKFLNEEFIFFDKNKTNVNFTFCRDLNMYISNGVIYSGEVINIITEKFSLDNVNTQKIIKDIFTWKETAEHYCVFNEKSDHFDSLPLWAQETLITHKFDEGKTIFTPKEIEMGLTNDNEFNAAQKELVLTGRMNEYSRIYWAKRFYYFIDSPEKALETMFNIYNRHAIDSNTPFSILNLMYSAGGVMDRGFKEVNVLGKIRALSSYHCNIYVEKWNNYELEEEY